MSERRESSRGRSRSRSPVRSPRPPSPRGTRDYGDEAWFVFARARRQHWLLPHAEPVGCSRRFPRPGTARAASADARARSTTTTATTVAAAAPRPTRATRYVQAARPHLSGPTACSLAVRPVSAEPCRRACLFGVVTMPLPGLCIDPHRYPLRTTSTPTPHAAPRCCSATANQTNQPTSTPCTLQDGEKGDWRRTSQAAGGADDSQHSDADANHPRRSAADTHAPSSAGAGRSSGTTMDTWEVGPQIAVAVLDPLPTSPNLNVSHSRISIASTGLAFVFSAHTSASSTAAVSQRPRRQPPQRRQQRRRRPAAGPAPAPRLSHERHAAPAYAAADALPRVHGLVGLASCDTQDSQHLSPTLFINAIPCPTTPWIFRARRVHPPQLPVSPQPHDAHAGPGAGPDAGHRPSSHDDADGRRWRWRRR